MKNYYPEKPEISYKRTQVEMSLVVGYLQKNKASIEIKRAAYVYFRNESGNGTKGLNNNYAGIQADSGRWPEKYDDKIIGVVSKTDISGKVRLFCAFADFTTSLDFLIERIEARGLYIGGTTHLITHTTVTNSAELALTYKREWATGNAKWIPLTENDQVILDNLRSMYRQSVKLFI